MIVQCCVLLLLIKYDLNFTAAQAIIRTQHPKGNNAARKEHRMETVKMNQRRSGIPGRSNTATSSSTPGANTA